MRAVTNNLYPHLRRCYSNLDELGHVINRNRVTVWRRLNGESDFTTSEMFLILHDLVNKGFESQIVPDTYKKYFEKEVSQ